jgi:hypothetical protein
LEFKQSLRERLLFFTPIFLVRSKKFRSVYFWIVLPKGCTKSSAYFLATLRCQKAPRKRYGDRERRGAIKGVVGKRPIDDTIDAGLMKQ